MPSNVIDTPRDEHLWEKAEGIATKHFGHKPKSDQEWAYTMGIYKKMKPDHKFKTANPAQVLNTWMARRVLARSEEEDAARAVFEGVAPDDGEWNGRGPELSFSWHPETKITAQKDNPSGASFFTGVFMFPGPRSRSEGGVYADSYLFVRYMKQYPKGEKALLKAFMEKAKPQLGKFKKKVEDDFQRRRPEQWFSRLVGFKEADEWEDVETLKVEKVQFANMPVLKRSYIYLPVVVIVKFAAVKKTPMNAAPFDSMSDREIMGMIEEWANMAPENFYMDGETDMSHRQLMKYYLKQWRAKRPRDQQRLIDDARGGFR